MHEKRDEKQSSRSCCPVCGRKRPCVFFEMTDVPLQCNRLWEKKEEAISCPRGDIRLAYCPSCSHISHIAFEPSKLNYTDSYENSLTFSPRFQDYMQSLAARLIERYDLYEKDLIEIGSGKGDFLVLLCKLGNNRGVGFDPAYVTQKEHREMGDQVHFVRDFYSKRYKDYPADFVVCRQTLEHMLDPVGFLSSLADALSNNNRPKFAFFEVPNGSYMLRRLAIWDIIYEHCSYFTPRSLLQTFLTSGFDICELTEEYGEQYLCIHATTNAGEPSRNLLGEHESQDRIGEYVEYFTTNRGDRIEKWRGVLEEMKNQGQRVVIWGAGSKGVTFLNVYRNQHIIEYVVDINPRKQGMYIPGTGEQIVPPEFIRDYRPESIIIMNPLYQEEIERTVQRLGVACRFVNV